MKRSNSVQVPFGAIAVALVLVHPLLNRALAADVAATADAQLQTRALSPVAGGADSGGQPEADEGREGAADAGSAGKMTLEKVRAAIADADKKRKQLLKPDPAAPDALLEQWGVQVQGISRTAGGYMLDFRFRVLDADKALSLFDHRVKPYVVAEKSGLKLPVPAAAKVGAFRPTNRGKNIRSDKTYYMIFANPDSYLKAGDKVSVIIGDFRVEHLTVN
jgi:hypothetical protein